MSRPEMNFVSVSSIATIDVYVIVVPKEGEKFTEFYVLGPGGMAEEYPIKLLKSFIIISSLWLD